MSGLTQRDIDVLAHYAENNNRELYWNYLARTPGNDGYGLLALGVVRNDNAPGATANAFADNRARQDGVQMSEREWNTFGVGLMQRDLRARQVQMEGGRPDLALNLPVKDVTAVHDASFRSRDIDPNAWTPRELLQAAAREGGQQEAARAWTRMLDNSRLGVDRGLTTLRDVARYDDNQLDALSYVGRMTWARMQGLYAEGNTNPDRIGTSAIAHVRDRDSGRWTLESTADGQTARVPERNPERIRELDDTRALRLERQQLRGDFHPDDPYRHQPVRTSPRTLAANEADPSSRETALAAIDPSQPGHARHALHCQCRDGVQALAMSPGTTLDDGARARLTASLTGLAAGSGMERVDHVVVGRGSGDGREGPNVFMVQGNLRDPAHQRAQMSLKQAITTPVEASHRELAAVDQRQAVQLQQAQQQTAEAQIDEPHRVHSRV